MSKVKIIPTLVFLSDVDRLKKKYRSLLVDLDTFEKELTNNPNTGISLGNNVRKIRLAIKSKNKGKSGGARVITYNVIVNVSEQNIFLLTIYDKSEQPSITKAEISAIIKRSGL